MRKILPQKKRKIPTPQNLANVALHYLGRYAASEASLRRVLQNRIRRSLHDNPELVANAERCAALYAAIENIIATHKRTGVLNDAAFAETKVNSLRRQGRSSRVIQQKLALKGIRGDMTAQALRQHADGDEPEEAELKAAKAFARRRKLGAFSRKEKTPEQNRKDFMTLARAGFSSGIAKQALQADIEEEWE